jgi:hypothetical protein
VPAGPAAPVQEELPFPVQDEPEPAASGQDEPVPPQRIQRGSTSTCRPASPGRCPACPAS